MNKMDIADRLADRLELSKTVARDSVDGVLDTIIEAMAGGEEVRLAGFGTFVVKDSAARTGRNPKTGEVLSIPASKRPSFKAGKALKDAVSGG